MTADDQDMDQNGSDGSVVDVITEQDDGSIGLGGNNGPGLDQIDGEDDESRAQLERFLDFVKKSHDSYPLSHDEKAAINLMLTNPFNLASTNSRRRLPKQFLPNTSTVDVSLQIQPHPRQIVIGRHRHKPK